MRMITLVLGFLIAGLASNSLFAIDTQNFHKVDVKELTKTVASVTAALEEINNDNSINFKGKAKPENNITGEVKVKDEVKTKNKIKLLTAIVKGEPKLVISKTKAKAKEKAQKEASAQMFTKDIPAVLSKADVKLYKELFRKQRARQRKQVAGKVGNLQDDILMGNLIAVRLLHPNTKASYTDLKNWLSKYNDQSMAKNIYKLANKRRPRGKSHKRPKDMVVSMAKYSDPDEVRRRKSARNTKQRRALIRKLKYYRVKKMYSKALTALRNKENQKMLGADTWAEVSITLANSMISKKEFKRTEVLMNSVLAKMGNSYPEALWLAGFSTYQQNKVKTAAGKFRKLSYSVSKNSKYFSKAAWWAGRTYEELGRKSMSKVFVNLAMQDRYSFYGQLAAEKMDRSRVKNWSTPEFKKRDKKLLLKNPVIRRVIALAQIGERGLAQQELKVIHSRVPYEMDQSLLTLSIQLGLPNTSLALSRNLKERGQVYLSGLYPEMKHWKPRTGYKVNKALIHAIVRQESAFTPTIKSRAGARGLMQLMPATAKYVRRTQKRPVYSRYSLLKPSVNMMIGQDYVKYLDKKLNGNLLHMVAAYNAGPGNVRKWVNSVGDKNDPILFIENIPFKETKKYVKRVMANLWMYRSQFSEKSPALTAMSNNIWPVQVAGLIKGRRSYRGGKS